MQGTVSIATRFTVAFHVSLKLKTLIFDLNIDIFKRKNQFMTSEKCIVYL